MLNGLSYGCEQLGFIKVIKFASCGRNRVFGKDINTFFLRAKHALVSDLIQVLYEGFNE